MTDPKKPIDTHATYVDGKLTVTITNIPNFYALKTVTLLKLWMDCIFEENRTSN